MTFSKKWTLPDRGVLVTAVARFVRYGLVLSETVV